MAILRVARLGTPVLRQRAVDVDPELIRKGQLDGLLEDMFETMDDYLGVGLAAPQIHLSQRIFVFAVDEAIARRKRVPPLEAGVFFNATYEPVGEKKVTEWEGCLSVPRLGGEVPRWETILLRGLDVNGKPSELKVKGYPARIFQHEIDHTDGVVYLDRMPDLRTLGYVS
jgi:peptide deformylase